MPADKDLYDLEPEEAKHIPTVCHSLDMALEHLDKDREFLTRGGVFTNDVIDAYIDLKMQEVTRFRMSHASRRDRDVLQLLRIDGERVNQGSSSRRRFRAASVWSGMRAVRTRSRAQVAGVHASGHLLLSYEPRRAMLGSYAHPQTYLIAARCALADLGRSDGRHRLQMGGRERRHSLQRSAAPEGAEALEVQAAQTYTAARRRQRVATASPATTQRPAATLLDCARCTSPRPTRAVHEHVDRHRAACGSSRRCCRDIGWRLRWTASG